MSAELQTDDWDARPATPPGTAPRLSIAPENEAPENEAPDSDAPEVDAPADDVLNRRRPNVSGDLPTVFATGPMFRRAVAGYDRFQVDTYVQWAEDELATADREREHLIARHLETRAQLAEARELLTHSPGGGEFLRLSQRIGSMLAAAADEAESITGEAAGLRAEAAADRAAAAAEKERAAARAAALLENARAQAECLLLDAGTEVEAMVAEAALVVDEAERTGRAARAEAEARLEEVRAVEQRAVEQAELLRRQAAEEASAARLRARGEIVRMLDTGREERRRADDEAAALRRRLDEQAVARRTALLEEVATLERRRAALRRNVQRSAARADVPDDRRLDASVRRVLARLRGRPRSLRAS